jgi:Holliday junction resolvase RusA-like endonuclease
MMFIDIVPMGAVRYNHAARWRPDWMKYQQWKDDLRILSRLYRPPAELSLTFTLPMPKSWSKKKRLEMDGQPHQQKPDLDNLIKAFKDALCEDDAYVHTYRNMHKVWGAEGSILVNQAP